MNFLKKYKFKFRVVTNGSLFRIQRKHWKFWIWPTWTFMKDTTTDNPIDCVSQAEAENVIDQIITREIIEINRKTWKSMKIVKRIIDKDTFQTIQPHIPKEEKRRMLTPVSDPKKDNLKNTPPLKRNQKRYYKPRKPKQHHNNNNNKQVSEAK